MATKQTPTTTTNEAATVQTEHRAQWATERARLAVTGLGGCKAGSTGRFARLADMLAIAEVQGERRITFAQANERMQAKRLTGPAGAASWRTLLQRFGQLDTGAAAWRIDAEAGAIVRRDA
jgi:hypothetical protein